MSPWLIVVLVLGTLLAVSLYVTVYVIRELLWAREDLQVTADVEHAKCMGAVMKFIGDEWAAQVLEVAASDYASAANQPNLDRIGRLIYKPGGPPVPTLWLQERAERLRIMAAQTDEVTQAFNDALDHVSRMNYNEVAL